MSTIIDEALFRKAKIEAARQGRPWSALLEDALRQYFVGGARRGDVPASVAATWAAVPAGRQVVRTVMEEEDGWLDAR